MQKTTSKKTGSGGNSQIEKKQSVSIGPGHRQISPVAYWYKNDNFRNDEEAQGAFQLAYWQGLDGMGASIQDWMGLTEKEFDDWMRDDKLPKKHD